MSLISKDQKSEPWCNMVLKQKRCLTFYLFSIPIIEQISWYAFNQWLPCFWCNRLYIFTKTSCWVHYFSLSSWIKFMNKGLHVFLQHSVSMLKFHFTWITSTIYILPTKNNTPQKKTQKYLPAHCQCKSNWTAKELLLSSIFFSLKVEQYYKICSKVNPPCKFYPTHFLSFA